jgi:RNA polymerase sigma-70 factor (ECF subfamily)
VRITRDVETARVVDAASTDHGMIVAMGDPARNEKILVKRAQRGQIDAFEALYRSHVGRVYAVCRRMCGDPSLAEELAQESFVRAWQKLASFRGESAFSTWLHRLTVNVVLGHLRSRSKAAGQPLGEEIEDRQPRGHDSQPGLAIDLERAIAGLPERARTVFVLHDVEGYRHREIAEMAGMAEGTSKAQLHRARRLLREVLR